MTEKNKQTPWDSLSHEEKNHELYLKQKHLLETFLEKGAISKAQYDKSLHDLTEKMGYYREQQSSQGENIFWKGLDLTLYCNDIKGSERRYMI